MYSTMIKTKGKKFNAKIIQTYVLTSMSTEEELDTFSEQLEMEYMTCKSEEIRLLMEDFNAKVGRGTQETVMVRFGLEERTIGEILLLNDARKRVSHNEHLVSISQ